MSILLKKWKVPSVLILLPTDFHEDQNRSAVPQRSSSTDNDLLTPSAIGSISVSHVRIRDNIGRDG